MLKALSQETKQLVAFVGIYLAFVLSMWLYLFLPTQYLQDSWERELHNYLERSDQLTNIVKEFGYGGFIDNFRQFIITKNIEHLDKAIFSLDVIEERLDIIQQLSDDEEFTDVVALVNNSTTEYQRIALSLKRNMAYSATMSYAILQRRITVQDADVIAAIKRLLVLNEQQLQNVRLKTEELKKAHDTKLVYWGMGASLLYVIGVFFLLFFQRSYKRAFSQLRCINDNSPVATLLFDHKRKVLQVNRAFCKIFGLKNDGYLSKINLEVLLPGVFERAMKEFQHSGNNAADEQDERKAMTIRVKAFELGGDPVPVKLSLSFLELDGRQVVFAIIEDKSKEIALKEKAQTDPLTQVYNRGYAEDLISAEIRRSKRSQHPFSILLVDVDYFKQVNDNLGHSAGDKRLLDIVHLLETSLREIDIIARWGGDEFLVLLPNTSLRDAGTIAKKLVLLTRERFKNNKVQTTVSIGAAEASHDDTQVNLINKADEALYETKLKGRDGYTLYTFD